MSDKAVELTVELEEKSLDEEKLPEKEESTESEDEEEGESEGETEWETETEGEESESEGEEEENVVEILVIENENNQENISKEQKKLDRRERLKSKLNKEEFQSVLAEATQTQQDGEKKNQDEKFDVMQEAGSPILRNLKQAWKGIINLEPGQVIITIPKTPKANKGDDKNVFATGDEKISEKKKKKIEAKEKKREEKEKKREEKEKKKEEIKEKSVHKKEMIVSQVVAQYLAKIPKPQSIAWKSVGIRQENFKPALSELHVDILIYILSYLHFRSFRELSRVGRVCSNLRMAIQHDYLWKNTVPLLKKNAQYVRNRDNPLLEKEHNILMNNPEEELMYDDFRELYKKSWSGSVLVRRMRFLHRHVRKPFRLFYCCIMPCLIVLGMLVWAVIFSLLLRRPTVNSDDPNEKFVDPLIDGKNPGNWVLGFLPGFFVIIPCFFMVVGMFLFDVLCIPRLTKKFQRYFDNTRYNSFYRPFIGCVFVFGFSIFPWIMVCLFFCGVSVRTVPYSVCFIPVYINTFIYFLLPIVFFYKLCSCNRICRCDWNLMKSLGIWGGGFLFHIFLDVQILLLTLFLDGAIVYPSAFHVFALFVPTYLAILTIFLCICFGTWIYSCCI